MDVMQMRNYIAKHPKYKNSPRWIDRVMRMPEPQVYAIYRQFQKADYRKIERDLKKKDKENTQYHQMNIFEYMEARNNG